MLNHILLRALCEIPSMSNHEAEMSAFLSGYAISKGWKVERDYLGNLKITKGLSKVYPAVCAHIDNVQPKDRRPIPVVKGDIITAVDKDGQQIGFGADDKTGIQVCLELMDCTDELVTFFFICEEYGMKGAQEAPKRWFKNIGCIIEFDCPARYMVSYSCAGTRLFKNDSAFAKRIVPVLMEHKYTHWQHHPYTDVKMLRMRFPIACLNLASGYYNWHSRSEYIRISEVEASFVLGRALLRELGHERYQCPVDIDPELDTMPACPIESLRVIDEHGERERVKATCPPQPLVH